MHPGLGISSSPSHVRTIAPKTSGGFRELPYQTQIKMIIRVMRRNGKRHMAAPFPCAALRAAPDCAEIHIFRLHAIEAVANPLVVGLPVRYIDKITQKVTYGFFHGTHVGLRAAWPVHTCTRVCIVLVRLPDEELVSQVASGHDRARSLVGGSIVAKVRRWAGWSY